MGGGGGIRPNYLAKLLAIIIVHNHPSGEPEPSNEDIAITKRVVDACNLMDMTVLDHIVIGKNKGDYLPSTLFEDNLNWAAFRIAEKDTLRDAEIKEVNKMLSCKGESRGFFTFYRKF